MFFREGKVGHASENKKNKEPLETYKRVKRAHCLGEKGETRWKSYRIPEKDLGLL